MRDMLFRKIVDQSILKEGLTVPKEVWTPLFEEIGYTLVKGEKKTVHILIDNELYDANLTNVNLAGEAERVQIRYLQNDPITVNLKNRFKKSAHYIENEKQKMPNKKQVLSLPTKEEYIDIYPVGNGTLKFICAAADEYVDRPCKDIVENVKAYIRERGFSYPEGLIENFYLSLKSKPFVILAGISGTGKTRLVKLFAEALGSTMENGRCKMVAVRPDWSDSSDLFGHVDLNGKFISGEILDFVEQAEEDPTRPYFLCLDEMNLARVEYYLSDILSVIETRDRDSSGKITTMPLVTTAYYGHDKQAVKNYGQQVRMPENLYIIGTVNMDETTFPFSRKVLDRANTIEFSIVNLMPDLADAIENSVSVLEVKNSFLKADYLLLKHCQAELEDVKGICLELEQINKILQIANAHVGYRVRDEIVFYMLNNKKAKLLPPDTAMDNEIMQKILPRIQGSSLTIKRMLCELFKHCAADYDGYQSASNDISTKMIQAIKNTSCRYTRSAEKIAFMVRRYEEDGFTSYWL